jgi:alginate O-acetyltransferase complex protein AlgI
MLFNSFPYAIFLVLVVLVLRRLDPGRRPGWLLAASLVFYGLWHPAYLLLFLVDLAANWWLLGRIARAASSRGWLAASVVWTLGILAIFKYADFALAVAAPLFEAVGLAAPEPVGLLLPLGISFYSFQLLGLAIDVHRGEGRPPRDFASYLLFIAFFPQLIAGPILRGNQLLPQLAAGGSTTPERDRRALWLLASGLAKKVLLGDFLLAPFVDEVFAAAGVAPASFHLVAAWGFALQIYCDFSGYCDLARGSALLLGFELPLNFTEPYLSRDPSEFWRRWHITLSQWLRDYLYRPLGGNRQGTARTCRNLFLTMLLGGLWHGANWTFVVWGAGHGLLLIVHRLCARRRRDPERPFDPWSDGWRALAMFNAAALLFVVFRAPDLATAGRMFAALFGPWSGQPVPLLAVLVVILGLLAHAAERALRPRLGAVQARFAEGPGGALLEGAAFGVVVALALVASGQGAEFIYFQF